MSLWWARSNAVLAISYETGGLVRLAWLLGETPVDSYLRLTDPADSLALIDAVNSLLPTPIPMEGDAT